MTLADVLRAMAEDCRSGQRTGKSDRWALTLDAAARELDDHAFKWRPVETEAPDGAGGQVWVAYPNHPDGWNLRVQWTPLRAEVGRSADMTGCYWQPVVVAPEPPCRPGPRPKGPGWVVMTCDRCGGPAGWHNPRQVELPRRVVDVSCARCAGVRPTTALGTRRDPYVEDCDGD